MSYGLPIETLDDWNARMCGCCEMPACPLPTQECESMTSEYHANTNASSGGDYYITANYSFYGNVVGSGLGTYDVDWSVRGWYSDVAPCGAVNPDTSATLAEVLAGAFPDGYTIIADSVNTPTGAVWTFANFVSAVLGDFATFTFPLGCAPGSACNASFSNVTTLPFLTPLVLRKARYRWAIPESFEGSYFKITWDVVFFPTTGTPTVESTDTTWEWVGPGDPEDEDSWKSDWYDLTVPESRGEKRVVNVRFTCYHGTKFGVKPQVMGEAYEA